MAERPDLEPPEKSEPASIDEELAAVRERLSEEREPRTFELPGYGSKLKVKYRVPTREERKEAKRLAISRFQAGDDDADIAGMCKELVTSCVAFYEEVDGKDALLNDVKGLGEDPVRWGDERLVDLLGIPASDVSNDKGEIQARRVIEAVLARPEIVEVHHSEVSLWMDRALEADDEDF